MTNLTSTVPATWAAFLGLIQTAASSVTINGEGVTVFANALTQNEPANYVILTDVYNHKWNPEGIGYQFREDYFFRGYATVYTGASPADNISVTTDVMGWTYDLYQQVVMQTMVQNANMPIFNASPTPFQGLPAAANYTASTGTANGGGQEGWFGRIDWAYKFSAMVYPS